MSKSWGSKGGGEGVGESCLCRVNSGLDGLTTPCNFRALQWRKYIMTKNEQDSSTHNRLRFYLLQHYWKITGKFSSMYTGGSISSVYSWRWIALISLCWLYDLHPWVTTGRNPCPQGANNFTGTVVVSSYTLCLNNSGQLIRNSSTFGLCLSWIYSLISVAFLPTFIRLGVPSQNPWTPPGYGG